MTGIVAQSRDGTDTRTSDVAVEVTSDGRQSSDVILVQLLMRGVGVISISQAEP